MIFAPHCALISLLWRKRETGLQRPHTAPVVESLLRESERDEEIQDAAEGQRHGGRMPLYSLARQRVACSVTPQVTNAITLAPQIAANRLSI